MFSTGSVYQNALLEMNEAAAAAVIGFVWLHDFVLDDDEEDTAWEKITVDINEFARMGDPAFRSHFRLTKPTFEILVTELGNYLVRKRLLQRERRPFPHMPLMVLWILATPDTFRSVALRFGVYPKEVHDHYVLLIKALRKMGRSYVRWPTENERRITKGNLQRISGFPGIIGMMDGMHVEIPSPAEDKAAYRNFHHGFSVKVQSVCDDKLLVRDVYIGEAGSLHDSRVFRRSPLCRNLFLDTPDMVSADEHIIADSAYPLYDKILTPFNNDGHLTPAQRNYNTCLSRVRCKAEHLFAMARTIWRRLFFLPIRNQHYLVDHIAAVFVLHNFRLLHGENVFGGYAVAGFEEFFYDRELGPPRNILPDPNVPQGPDARAVFAAAELRGEQKRWDICNRLAL